jgi:hypothetical protein
MPFKLRLIDLKVLTVTEIQRKRAIRRLLRNSKEK